MCKVLIVEDDVLIADMNEHILLENGYEVCGIARTVAEAVRLARLHKPDLAVIDMRLAEGGLGTEVVEQLTANGRLGILYATGNISNALLTSVNGDACLGKPYGDDDLLRGLKVVRDIVATGVASAPFPHAFRVLLPDLEDRSEIENV